MKIISKTYDIPLFSSKQISAYFDDMKLGVFDIETLGLNADRNPMVLAGFMSINEENQCVFTQYFAECPEEEPLLLLKLKKEFDNVDYLLTFNGKHFDIPFVKKRALHNKITGINADLYNLDLYLILNGHSEIKHVLKNLKQKTVEEYMGLKESRDDEISGADSIKLYNSYVKCLCPEEKQILEDKILLHNHDDLVQLYQLMPILKQVDIHKALYTLGFPIKGKNGWPTLNITSIKLTNTGINVCGKYNGEKISYISYETFKSPFSCEFQEDGTFKFNLRIDKHKGNIFINLPAFINDFDDFKKYPNFIKNFLLISNSNSINYLETNMFIKDFITHFMEEH